MKKNKYNNLLKSKTINIFALRYIAAVVILTICKYLFAFTRPLCELNPNNFILPYPQISKVCAHSFPSAHSAFACLLAISLWSYVSNLPRIFLVLLVLTTGASRVVLAMHYPADVLYGILLAILIHFIVSKIVTLLWKS